MYRGNTGNTGYGFEQVLGKGDGQVNIYGQLTAEQMNDNIKAMDQKRLGVDRFGKVSTSLDAAQRAQKQWNKMQSQQQVDSSDDDEPNVYNFHVAGNLKAMKYRKN